MLTLAEPRDRIALIQDRESCDYRRLLRSAWHEAHHLKSLRTPQVVICAENSINWAVAAYATWAAERVLVPLDAQSSVDEISYVLGDAQASVVYVSRKTADAVSKAVAQLADEERPIVRPLEGLLLPADASPSARAQASAIVVNDESRLATIIYTSGTTGEPKGVMLSFGNLRANLDAVRLAGYFAPDERVLMFLPLHHVLPLMGNLMAPLTTGGLSVIAPSLARQDIVACLVEHKITMIIGVPRFYELLGRAIEEKIQATALTRAVFTAAQRLNNPAAAKRLFARVHQGFGGQLRYMICGGAPLDPQIAALFHTLGFRLCEGYGMTECAPMITFPAPNAIKPGYCGKPLEGSQVELRDEEVFVRGPQVMLGYFGKPEQTAEVLQDGWLRTGDNGEFDSAGNLRITGRKKEIIVLPNGKNVSPSAGEVLLEESCPLVEEAAIFLDGDVLHALIVPKKTELPSDIDDLASYFYTRALAPANQKVAPHRRIAKLTIVEEPLPRTRLSKLRRHLLADVAQRAAAVQHQAPREEAQDAHRKSTSLRLLLDHLRRPQTQPSGSSKLGADLGLDSLARLELLEFVRKTMGVRLTEQDLTDQLSLHQLSQLIDANISTTSSSLASPSVNDPDLPPAEQAVSWSDILSANAEDKLPGSGLLHGSLLLSSRGLTRSLARLTVIGADNIPEGPVLFAPNHQSALDGAFLASALSWTRAKDVHFLGKAAHLSKPWVRYLADNGHVIVLESQAIGESLRAVAAALRAGHSVCVFPEGTRTRTGELGDFKESYAIVARELGIPVVPVVIDGSISVLPPGKTLLRPFKKVVVSFLPALASAREAAAPAGTEASALNDRVALAIQRELERLHGDSH